MLVQNAFKMKKPLCTTLLVRTSLYNRAEKGEFSSHNIAEKLNRNESTVHDFVSSGPGKPLPQENYGPTTVGLPITEKTTVFTTMLGNIVVNLQQKLQFFQHQSDTMNCNKLIVCKTALGQMSCSVHTISSKSQYLQL
ncbi:hypothetical protein TNCV_3286161 [Trichonephila clavipes]|nr:hypothetical protein TNCV_3286161 [Trichonephila clavipes]